MKVPRQEFIQSSFLRIQLISYEKKWVHHNRYNLQITLDKQNLKIKKKYSQLKRFSEEVQKNLGVKKFALQNTLRTQDQYKNIEGLMKRLNSQFLQIKQQNSQKQKGVKRQIRNYLYNMLFYNEEMNFSDDDQIEEKPDSGNLNEGGSGSKTSINTQQKPQKGLKGKSMAIAASLVSTVLKKIQVEPMKQIFKNISIVWLRRSNKWHECRLITSQTSLILHDRYQNLKIIIILCKMSVFLVEQPYQRIIIQHRLLKQKIQLRLTNLNQPSLRQRSQQDLLTNKYLAFYSVLKSLCHKQRMVQTYNFVKIRLVINKTKLSSTLSNTTNSSTITIVDKKANKQIGLKLIHNTIISAFTIFPEYPCEIIVPIVSNFGVLEFFMSQVKQHGVIPSFKQGVQNFSIPVQNVYDALYNIKPKRKTQIRNITVQTKNGSANFSLQYSEAGTLESYYTCNMENDKFQGNMQFDQPNKDQVRVQFNRLKRIAWTAQQYISVLGDLQNFTNPVLSYIYYAFLVLLVIVADMNYAVHYTLGGFILIMLYNHPSFQAYINEAVQYTSFSSQYTKLKSLLTLKLRNSIQSKQSTPTFSIKLKKDLQKSRFLQNFQLTMKKKRNIYKKYKRLQQILINLQNVLMQLVNYIQKVKNIFTWYHHKKTRLVYLGMICFLIVIIFIPIRFILLIAIYKMFKKGKVYYKKTRQYNEKVIGEIFSMTIKQNKLDDIMVQCLYNDGKLINKKDTEYVVFEKKVKESLQNVLGIQFQSMIFQNSKSFRQLKYALSLCKKRYKIPIQVCRKYELNQKFAYQQSSLAKIIRIVLGFIAVIPSDRNILGLKQDVEQQSQQKTTGVQSIQGQKNQVQALDD